MKYNLLLLSTLLSLMAFSPSVLAIQKCQDADGSWHYGDVAVIQCENSKVTTLNERGFITQEEQAPKTAEELKEEENHLAVQRDEKLRLKQEQDEKIRVLSIYETEADIDRQRDNQLNSVQGNIDVHESYIKSMGTRIERFETQKTEITSERRKERIQTEIDQANARVLKSQEGLVQLLEQKDDIIKKFGHEKEIYLRLKNSN